MDRKALIYLNIPKTAGTVLNCIIELQYNPLSIFTLDPYRIHATAGVDATLEVATGRGHGVRGLKFQPMIKTFFDKYLRNR
jgi:hypothetical protein